MPDLAGQLSAILSDPEAQKNIQAMLSSLGLGGGQNAESQPQGQPSAAGSSPSGMPDLSGLAAMFGGGGQSQSNSNSTAPSGMPDLSGLAAMFGGGGQSQPNSNGAAPSGMPDLSGLAAMFGGGGQSQPEAPILDMNTIMAIQSVFSRMNADDKNISLLRALRPHLREPSKVDEAIRILQLISVLPALTESGLFGGKKT